MTPRQKDILLRATGDGECWRGRYCATTSLIPDCDALCDVGLMYRRDPYYWRWSTTYTVTDAGYAAAAELRWDRETSHGYRAFWVRWTDGTEPNIRWCRNGRELKSRIISDISVSGMTRRKAGQWCRDAGMSITPATRDEWMAECRKRMP